MALFRCASSSDGAGATITVTYNSSFYNKTMTCSNGIKTYTKTTTSSGSTEFNVSDEGTWTITCNGISRTVYVTLNYSTAMAITKTVTVYGAAGATISFTDAVGSKTVTLDNSGQGSASITFIPPSQSITFTDTNVAKNPDNLSQNYSRIINLTESLNSIYVMPDGALYWYGWNPGWHTGDTSDVTFTNNTNSQLMTGTGTFSYVWRLMDVTNASKITTIITACGAYSALYLNNTQPSGGWDSLTIKNQTQADITTPTKLELNISAYSGNKYIGFGMYYARSVTIQALIAS